MNMKRFDLELAVGMFLLLGVIALGYISIKLGQLEIMGTGGYRLYADFTCVNGIENGAVVEIAGVKVGKVNRISLTKNYQAMVELSINPEVRIQEDAIASVKTKGLVGEKYIQITPGGSEKILPQGGRIRETESAVDIEELISKYAFGKV